MKEGELGDKCNSKAGSTNIDQQWVRILSEVRVTISSSVNLSGDNPEILPLKQGWSQAKHSSQQVRIRVRTRRQNTGCRNGCYTDVKYHRQGPGWELQIKSRFQRKKGQAFISPHFPHFLPSPFFATDLTNKGTDIGLSHLSLELQNDWG